MNVNWLTSFQIQYNCISEDYLQNPVVSRSATISVEWDTWAATGFSFLELVDSVDGISATSSSCISGETAKSTLVSYVVPSCSSDNTNEDCLSSFRRSRSNFACRELCRVCCRALFLSRYPALVVVRFPGDRQLALLTLKQFYYINTWICILWIELKIRRLSVFYIPIFTANAFSITSTINPCPSFFWAMAAATLNERLSDPE